MFQDFSYLGSYRSIVPLLAPLQGLRLALASIVIFALLSAFEILVLGRAPLEEAPARFDFFALVKTGLALFCSAAIVLGLRPERGQDTRLSGRWRRAALASLTIAIGLTLVFALSAEAFYQLGREDGPIEWTTAGLALLASLLLIGRALRSPDRPAAARIAVALLGAVLLVLAGEEISWGQRLIGLETPDLFAANLQNETNLHNFASNTVEMVSYLGAFGLLVVLPFSANMAGIGRLGAFAAFVPRPAVAAVSAPLTAFNYDQWNIFPVQIAFFSTVLIFLLWALGARERSSAGLYIGTALLLVVAQASFLYWGEAFRRLHDVTEHKEFFIAAGLLVYAVHIVRRMRKPPPCPPEQTLA